MFSYFKASQRRNTLPVSPLFVPGKIFVLDKEGAAGRSGLQVELGHVRHSEVDGTIVSEEETRSIFWSTNVNSSQTVAHCQPRFICFI